MSSALVLHHHTALTTHVLVESKHKGIIGPSVFPKNISLKLPNLSWPEDCSAEAPLLYSFLLLGLILNVY